MATNVIMLPDYKFALNFIANVETYKVDSTTRFYDIGLVIKTKDKFSFDLCYSNYDDGRWKPRRAISVLYKDRPGHCDVISQIDGEISFDELYRFCEEHISK